MSYVEEKKCPLCAEEMDWTDQQLNPCKCGYEVCVWCWHHIMDMAEKDATEGRCPACRTPYDKDRIVGLETNFQRVSSNSSSRKQKLQKAKSKPNEGRKDLSNVRVIQRKMAYIIGLPLDLADEDLLQRKSYFGQYGKIMKVSLSRTSGGALQQLINDTCSVYITYSKEDEAVTCIQSVHGYVLDGRLLRASFGTAKYCHAWLRNTSCDNPACLYLHTLGAEEDSFGKDEVAAVHTRNRVQEIVGATQYLQRRAGTMLPPPVIGRSNNHSASAEDPVFDSGLKVRDYNHDEAYGTVASGGHLSVKSSKQMTSFVDIVGQSSSSSSDKDVNSRDEDQRLNDETEIPDSVIVKSSTPNQLADSPTYDDQRLKGSVGSGHTVSCFPSYPADTTKECSDISLGHNRYHNHNHIGSYTNEEDTVRSPYMNSVFSDGFQSSAKSDRIYRGSNSFSNEEIVERLRRIDDDTLVDNDNDENFASFEDNIISNILSLDLDGDNSDYPRTVARDGRNSSAWNIQNNGQSSFSYAKEHEFSGQRNDLVSPSNIGQGLTFSGLQNSSDNKNSFFTSQHQAPRTQNMTPPGFTMISKPPPGFSTSTRTDQNVSANSGNYYRAAPNNLYRSPSFGNLSNSSDDLVGGVKPATNGLLTSSWTSSFPSRCSIDDNSKQWLFTQQQSGPVTAPHHHHHHETQLSQPTMQQYHHTTPQFPSSQGKLYGGISSGVVDPHHQSYNPSSYNQQPPKFAGGYQQHNINHLPFSQQHDNRSEVGRFGFDSRFLPTSDGDYMFQMPPNNIQAMYTPGYLECKESTF
ncbi:uncharacterized protein [Rutidosis leptorrhynchoides]|uniref:uncharacterized protein isoform X2 n=1 Tax=Rutidosis leptorrhynchoides TaxID=125765 RepID=UPI003A99FF23